MAKPIEFEKHGQVLVHLAVNSPRTKYQMEKAITPRIDHATLHKIVSDLKETASVKVVKIGRSRVGLKMEYYDLRLAGVIGAIQQDRGNMLNLDAVAKKYRSYLPLIFRKWQFFREMGWDPSERLRTSSFIGFNWARWFSLITRGEAGAYYSGINEALADATGVDGCVGGPTRGFRNELAYYLTTRPNARETKQMLARWESILTDALYLAFFNIWMPEYVWIQHPTTKQHYLAKHEAETSKLDRIWTGDPEIRKWIMGVLHDVAGMYSERVQWFEKRRTRLVSLKVTRPPHA